MHENFHQRLCENLYADVAYKLCCTSTTYVNIVNEINNWDEHSHYQNLNMNVRSTKGGIREGKIHNVPTNKT